MTLALLFWILMILWLAFSIYSGWPLGKPFAGSLLLWVILAIIGWQIFGAAIHK